jgi:hypothetical protein
MRTLIRAGLMGLGLMTASANATELAGVEIPLAIRAEGQQQVWYLMGTAQVHRSFVPFYGLALHGPSGAGRDTPLSQGLTPLQLTLVWYASELPREQVQEHFRKLFEQVTTPETRDRVEPRLDKFIEMLPNAVRGEQVVFYYSPDAGTRVTLSDGTAANFAGIEFNRALISMWLGPQADAAVREGLTGSSADE